MIALAAVSLAPDADVLSFAMRIPYGAPFGHRGASHSLAAAAVAGVVASLAAPDRVARGGRARAGLGVLVFGVAASHGLLDAMTDGGRGVALLWPTTAARFFLPLRPIPVAPIGGGLVSARGARVAAIELVEFLPLVLYAFTPRRGPSSRRPPSAP
jgi:inner membrane protein